MCGHTHLCLRVIQTENSVASAANFKGAWFLKILALEKQLRTSQFIQKV